MIRSIAMLSLLLILGGCSNHEHQDWAMVSKGNLLISVEIDGTLESTDFKSFGPPKIDYIWNYVIADMSPDGEPIKKGGTLLSFDTKKIREALENEKSIQQETLVSVEKTVLEIKLAKQNDALALAELEAAQRKASMAASQSKDLTGRLQLQQAQLDLDTANLNIKHFKSQRKTRKAINTNRLATLRRKRSSINQNISQYQEDIESMAIKADRDGTAFHRKDWHGKKYKTGDEVWSMTTAINIASLDSMMAKGTIEEADIANVKVGQRVHLRLESHPDNTIEGTLTKISRSVQQKSNEEPFNVVSVELSIESSMGLPLRPGMRFRGEVETEHITNALFIPQKAVFPSSQGPVAFVKKKGKTVRAILKLGKQAKRNVEILEGLDEGDLVSQREVGQVP